MKDVHPLSLETIDKLPVENRGTTVFNSDLNAIKKGQSPMMSNELTGMQEEGVNSLFKFRNPNATGECGCGESFTVDEV